MNNDVLIVILIMGLATFLTRILPFMFGNYLEKQTLVKYIGKHLPLMIMPILVIASISNSAFQEPWAFKEELFGILLVIGTHHFFNKPLLSIFGGTLFYIIAVSTGV